MGASLQTALHLLLPLMKTFGIILIVLGLLGLALGSITFTQTEEVADIGPLEIQTEETKSFPIAPVASGAAVVAGIALLAVGARKK